MTRRKLGPRTTALIGRALATGANVREIARALLMEPATVRSAAVRGGFALNGRKGGRIRMLKLGRGEIREWRAPKRWVVDWIDVPPSRGPGTARRIRRPRPFRGILKTHRERFKDDVIEAMRKVMAA